MMRSCAELCQAFTRRKTIDPKSLNDTKLKRRLNVFDVVGVGVGSSLGLGIYVIITHVVKNEAGPSSVLSVLLAGVGALLSSMCYAEFACRLPRAGASYFYIYAVLGELSAFVVGWTMILENIIGAAAAAKAWSQYIDSLFNGTVHRYFDSTMRLTAHSGMSNSPDVLACVIVLIAVVIVMINVKVSAVLSCIFTVLNGLVVVCIICVGFFHVRHENWTDPPGFFAYGFSGIVNGAAILYFAFLGIETIASTAEETKKPTNTTPTALFSSLVVCFILYFSVTCALTLSFPWNKLPDDVALPYAFYSGGIDGAKYVITVGGVFGLAAATIGFMFSLPRLLFSMANDRLISKCFGHVNTCSHIPVLSVLFPGLLVSLIALFFRLETMIEIMSIGTIVSYSLVAVSVVCLRYQPEHIGLFQEYDEVDDDHFTQCTEFVYASFSSRVPRTYGIINQVHGNVSSTRDLSLNNKILENYVDDSESKPLKSHIPKGSTYHKMDSVINSTPDGSVSSIFQIPSDVSLEPTEKTLRVTTIALASFIVTSVVLALMVRLGGCYVAATSWWAVAIIVTSSVVLVTCTALIAKQPHNQTRLFYQTPYVPFVPLIAILLNVFLLTSLAYTAWIRFSVWLFLGLVLYMCYGLHRSVERDLDEQEVVLYEIDDSEEQTYVKTK